MIEKTLKWKPVAEGCPAPDYAGVYQIYGRHPVYGKKEPVLLYIGQAKNLLYRLNEHEFIPGKNGKGWSTNVACLNPKQCELYTAICAKKILNEVEKLLIFAHSPAWNSEHIRWYHNIAKDFCIYNTGEKQDLYAEVKVCGGKLTME